MTSVHTSPLLPHKQHGAIILVTVVLMLVMITLVTLYTGKIQSFEHKIILNSQNKKLAFAAAESGLMRGFAELQQHKEWSIGAINEVLLSQNSYTVTATQQLINRHDRELALIQLTSTGVSADGLATSTVTQQALVYPLIVQIPKAPVLVAGGLNDQVSFELAANPNGGGESVPLSIWSNAQVDMDAIVGFTCALEEYSSGICPLNAYSFSMNQGADILSNDANFPVDIFAYLFNVSFQHYSAIKSEADLVLNDCLLLNNSHFGIVWVDGDCHINNGLNIGDAAYPVLLFVNDGSLHLGLGSTLNGLVFMLKQNSTLATFDVFIPPSSSINGALLANYPLGDLAGSLYVKYDQTALATLTESPTFLRVAKIPGSWHDL
ncbi:MAG: hypothetical protein NWQ54_08025 [Paraglaciecola sp.]|nr:hypothetical protein [Paraglaciecola sp.]